MELTTGAILRRITETPLSVSAHKLATLILDGIAWKDGYNGLDRGTAAFTLGYLAERMGVSRQHLSLLLGELAASALALVRWKPNGRFAPWLFRFGAVDNSTPEADVVSATDDTSLSRVSKNKMIFAGKIEFQGASNVHRTPWAELIKGAKTALPCWNVDTQVIWDAFRTFNRAKGKDEVPAGYLLGFMRKWRTSLRAAGHPVPEGASERMTGPREMELHRLIAAAPSRNREFHASDLRRVVGEVAYEARIIDAIRQFECPKFAASLAVHGKAVLAGEISQ